MNHVGSGGNADLYSECSHFMWVRTQHPLKRYNLFTFKGISRHLQLIANYGCGSISHTFGILVSGCTQMHVNCNLCIHSQLQFTCVCVQPDTNTPNV